MNRALLQIFNIFFINSTKKRSKIRVKNENKWKKMSEKKIIKKA